jgi:hypothetical protein
MIASKCFIEALSAPPRCGPSRLWLTLPASCRPGARQCRRRTSQPVVLRSGRLVFAVVLLSLLQELGQRRDIQITKSSARQSRCDFLKQPSIAVGITKRGKRVVAGMLGYDPADATAAVDPELSARRSGVKHLTHLNTACDKIFPCCLNVGHD